jgi:hypothetical protein
VIWALLLLDLPVSVLVFLGVILLAGIVVNNAIVLVDYAGQLKARGHSTDEALAMAGQVRLRPILMTTLTTVLGLIPMALGPRRRRRAAHADGDHGDRGARVLDAADADRDPDAVRGRRPGVRRGGGGAPRPRAGPRGRRGDAGAAGARGVAGRRLRPGGCVDADSSREPVAP